MNSSFDALRFRSLADERALVLGSPLVAVDVTGSTNDDAMSAARTGAAHGATFVADATAVSADAAVALMAGYFGGVLAGRTLGSRLARRHDPARLLALALAVTAGGFAILWPAAAPAQALIGLSLLGIGLGNLFPMGLSVTVALAPDRAAVASGRAVATTSCAVLLAPLAVGTLADSTSLTAALGVVPVALAFAALGLAAVHRARRAPRTAALASASLSRDAG